MTSGRPAFQQHTKRTEGSDTTHASHTQKALSAGHTSRNFDRNGKDHAAQRGRDAFGAATRINASLLRRLSAFFRSVSDQDPKAAKLAVLIPGPGMLVNVRNALRVVIPPPSETPPVSACVPLCAIFLRKPSVYPFLPVKTNVSHLCEKLKNAMKSDLEQRCGGNFWTIFARTILGEKPNFTGRFFEWRRPFDFSTR